MTNDELQIRREAVAAIIECYENMNNNLSKPLRVYNNCVPGWLPRILSPTRPDLVNLFALFDHPGQLIDDRYYIISRAEVPEEGIRLADALDSLKNKTGWCTECTSAAHFVKFAIINRLLPGYFDTFNRDRISELIKSNVLDIQSFKGYEIPDLGVTVDTFVHDTMPLMNNRKYKKLATLTAYSAQRRYLLDQKTKDSIYTRSLHQGSDHMLAGDPLYIYGHPDYPIKHPDGSSRGENVFCIGYNDEGKQLFMGFYSFFMTGCTASPRTLEDIRANLAHEYMIESPSQNWIEKETYESALAVISSIPCSSVFLLDPTGIAVRKREWLASPDHTPSYALPERPPPCGTRRH